MLESALEVRAFVRLREGWWADLPRLVSLATQCRE